MKRGNKEKRSERMNKKQGNHKLAIILAVALILISLIAIISALTGEDKSVLQGELNNLTSELDSSGYSWLVNYTIQQSEQPSISVYRKNSSEEIAKFENILNEGYYKIYLSNLSDNETLDVFDLKVACESVGGLGGVNGYGSVSGMDINGSVNAGKVCSVKIPYDIMKMKIKLDEIKKRLK